MTLFALAFAAGLASALAFQPVGLWPLMPIAFAALHELLARVPDRRGALAVGWGFGLGQFVLGLNWIATAFTYQAAMPAWLGWVAVVLLSLYLAVYPLLAAGLAWRIGRGAPLAQVLALAGGWAVTEWLRATIFTGFAWNPVGVTLADTPWLATGAYFGTYGLSALVVLAGGMLWLLARRSWQPPLYLALVLGLLLVLPRPMISPPGALKVFDVAQQPAPPPPPGLAPVPHRRAPPPPPVTPHSAFATGRIRIVQPNIGQADKWRDGFAAIAARRLEAISTRPDAGARDLGPAETLFWPEAAVTEPLADERTAAAPYIAAERARAVSAIRPGQLLATGGLGLTASDRMTVDGATNSVFVLDSAGTIVARYDKAHLVPYGEYLPMRPILSAIGLSRLAPGDLDFRPGPGPRTLHLPNGRKMGVQVCYEIIFSGAVADRSDRPDYIFNPSNDAWFGSWGPPQHLAQARLRAAEEAVPIIRATPTGISALVDAHGGLVAHIAPHRAGLVDSGLPLSAADPTPFARAGNAIPLVLAALLLIAAIVLGRARRYSRSDI